jgi:hypothetical protein
MGLLYGPGLDGLPDGAQRILLGFGITAARTMNDLLALYPPDREEEELWHQASL